MSFFTWSDDYAVHHQAIDRDHKGLVDTVNALYDAIREGAARDRIGSIISKLELYVDEHFAREEALMERHLYPDIVQHKRLHRHLANTVHAIHVIFDEKPQRLDPVKLLNFLRDWLVHHILSDDMKYTPFLTIKTASSEAHQAKEVERASEDAEERPLLVPRDPDDFENETIMLSVPTSKAVVLRRCARILAEGGTESLALEHIAMAASRMTFNEALHLARPVLR